MLVHQVGGESSNGLRDVGSDAEEPGLPGVEEEEAVVQIVVPQL
ncbi:MAG: hypothetical protein METHAR1v1_1630012, partial [Methanothrix sp.]